MIQSFDIILPVHHTLPHYPVNPLIISALSDMELQHELEPVVGAVVQSTIFGNIIHHIQYSYDCIT